MLKCTVLHRTIIDINIEHDHINYSKETCNFTVPFCMKAKLTVDITLRFNPFLVHAVNVISLLWKKLILWASYECGSPSSSGLTFFLLFLEYLMNIYWKMGCKWYIWWQWYISLGKMNTTPPFYFQLIGGRRPLRNKNGPKKLDYFWYLRFLKLKVCG